jgi:Protein of unknown function (DUF742)
MSANPWVRPYVLTRGRTRTRHRLYVHTLVSVDRYDRAVAGRLAPEARRLYEHAAASPQSVAELSAHCDVSLGVTRVLLEDLASAGRVHISADTYDSPFDQRLLKRVIDGLREFA